jgi:hypothetical protein
MKQTALDYTKITQYMKTRRPGLWAYYWPIIGLNGRVYAMWRLGAVFVRLIRFLVGHEIDGWWIIPSLIFYNPSAFIFWFIYWLVRIYHWFRADTCAPVSWEASKVGGSLPTKSSYTIISLPARLSIPSTNNLAGRLNTQDWQLFWRSYHPPMHYCIYKVNWSHWQSGGIYDVIQVSQPDAEPTHLLNLGLWMILSFTLACGLGRLIAAVLWLRIIPNSKVRTRWCAWAGLVKIKLGESFVEVLIFPTIGQLFRFYFLYFYPSMGLEPT